MRRELPIPVSGPGKVLVRLAQSVGNFMDIHTRQGKYAGSRTYPQVLPTTLGIDGAGTIEVLGEDVTKFVIGERVAYCLCWGSYGEFAVVPAWRVVRVPDALPLERAAAVMFHGLTAHDLAYDLGHFAPCMTCLVHSTSGGIGPLLLQLGARIGATVFATTSTGAKAEVARSRGAATTFLYDEGRFADRVSEAAGGRGVDVVFVPIGCPTPRDSLCATRTRGLVVAFGSGGGNVEDLDPIGLGEAGPLFLTRPRLADHLPNAATIRRRATDILNAVLDDSLSLEVSRHYTPETMAQAHEAFESRCSVGKPLMRTAPETA